MNRAFFIIVAPAILVAAAYLAVFWGKIVPAWLAFGVAGVAILSLVIHVFRKPADKPRA